MKIKRILGEKRQQEEYYRKALSKHETFLAEFQTKLTSELKLKDDQLKLANEASERSDLRVKV